ncbi:alpha/beta hydrolase [Thalassococcus lentus]|uniref:Alpha/beta hydrolase n=1 Tax=Thalassococcus lentus TaxID=1210524 RepID=A0ABT4XWF8_9RHOB|nr:alpha/beta hydrolase [Thalassococcus lentus]MDA7426287.1 alpha/beta hydrolase [Thalassococcus lentus]
MSLMRRPLNVWLRLTQKPHMRRAKTQHDLRRRLELDAKLFFHAPFGTRMQSVELGSRTALRVAAKTSKGDASVLYFHGGGYVFGSPRTHSAMLAVLSKKLGSPCLLPQYRLAPEHPFPAAIDDALEAYKALENPSDVVLGGDSAGGGLVLALLGEILRLGLPKPRGAFVFSPLTDFRFRSESLRDNAEADVILPAERVEEMAEQYLGSGDRADPRASPIEADFTGSPPIWLCAGTTEILLDDSRRMASHLRSQGITVTECIEYDLPHVWPLFHNILPEARHTLEGVSDWINRLPRPANES